MFVKSMMIPKQECYTAQEDETLQAVLKKMEQHQIDGVPVLQGDRYAGVATRYSIYENYFLSNKPKEEYLSSTTVKDIATHQEKFLEGRELFEKTLLDLKDFPLLAVVGAAGEFLGIVTRADVLSTFESAFGEGRHGVKIAFTSVETEGRIARFSEIAHRYRVHIISLVTFDETDKLVRRMVMKVEKNDNLDKFTKELEKYGFRILSLQED